ncbi:hypothetical protein EYF80_029842 [Liparis tanakae]|uniref:Uncharacterized protein n=1 Tax=Liparis tanakae TaxID=230148 RepID=A0A4Z2H240_9TELE|nr:hypothetical protein EYF80_029842 [Liparis tanakae]
MFCVGIERLQQHQLQQAAEGTALPDLIASGVYSQDIWTQVVDLLLKLQPEEDVAEARTQALHAAHLEEEGQRRGVGGEKRILGMEIEVRKSSTVTDTQHNAYCTAEGILALIKK